MANPILMSSNIENGGTLITNFKKKEEEIIVWTWEKGKKLKSCQKMIGVDKQELPVPSL